MKFLIMMLIAGITYRFVRSLEQYKGDARSIATLLWRAAEIIVFAVIFNSMAL